MGNIQTARLLEMRVRHRTALGHERRLWLDHYLALVEVRLPRVLLHLPRQCLRPRNYSMFSDEGREPILR
jgi:hypothetical protein